MISSNTVERQIREDFVLRCNISSERGRADAICASSKSRVGGLFVSCASFFCFLVDVSKENQEIKDATSLHCLQTRDSVVAKRPSPVPLEGI